MQIEILDGLDVFFSSSGDTFKSSLYTYGQCLNHHLQGNKQIYLRFHNDQTSDLYHIYSLANDLCIPVIPRTAICVADLLL